MPTCVVPEKYVVTLCPSLDVPMQIGAVDHVCPKLTRPPAEAAPPMVILKA
jgi:hypothetical protein